MEHGHAVQNGLTDNGVLKADSFIQNINEHPQQLRFCGTNAHHQNGVAEIAIQAVSNIARSMLLDGSAYWKNNIEPDLWPMTIIYAAYIHFHTPRNQVCPADVFFGSTVSCHCPKDLHVWVCPEFVLETKPQEGQNLPRWEPGSCKGMHIELCHVHASYVPLISSLTTAAISPRF